MGSPGIIGSSLDAASELAQRVSAHLSEITDHAAQAVRQFGQDHAVNDAVEIGHVGAEVDVDMSPAGETLSWGEAAEGLGLVTLGAPLVLGAAEGLATVMIGYSLTRLARISAPAAAAPTLSLDHPDRRNAARSINPPPEKGVPDVKIPKDPNLPRIGNPGRGVPPPDKAPGVTKVPPGENPKWIKDTAAAGQGEARQAAGPRTEEEAEKAVKEAMRRIREAQQTGTEAEEVGAVDDANTAIDQLDEVRRRPKN